MAASYPDVDHGLDSSGVVERLKLIPPGCAYEVIPEDHPTGCPATDQPCIPPASSPGAGRHSDREGAHRVARIFRCSNAPLYARIFGESTRVVDAGEHHS